MWIDRLQGGCLKVEIDPTARGTVLTLVGVWRDCLTSHGFNATVVRRGEIALIELLTNCAVHAGGLALVELQVQWSTFRFLAVTVTDGGPGFTLDEVLRRELAMVEEGGPEHGLLRLCRHVDELKNSGPVVVRPGVRAHTVACQLYDHQIRESILDEVAGLAVVQILLTEPSVIRVVDELYPGESFQKTVLLNEGEGTLFLDRYLHGVRDQEAKWVGLEISGDGARSGSLHAFHAILSEKFVKYFAEYIKRRRLLIYAHNCDWYVGIKMRELAAAHDLPFVTSRAKCQAFLTGGSLSE